MRRELLFARCDDVLFFTNNIGYIFIVRRLEKQSNPILSRSDSISNLEPNLKIHGPCGPNAHAGADLQVSLTFCFKPNLLSAHKLTLLIYGDNTCPLVLAMIIPKPLRRFIFRLMLIKTAATTKEDATSLQLAPRRMWNCRSIFHFLLFNLIPNRLLSRQTHLPPKAK